MKGPAIQLRAHVGAYWQSLYDAERETPEVDHAIAARCAAVAREQDDEANRCWEAAAANETAFSGRSVKPAAKSTGWLAGACDAGSALCLQADRVTKRGWRVAVGECQGKSPDHPIFANAPICEFQVVKQVLSEWANAPKRTPRVPGKVP